MGGQAQGRGSPRVHPGLQDPVALSWGEWVLFKLRSGRKGRDYVERKRIITLLDFQRSTFHEGSSCGIMQRGNIQILYVLVSRHSPTACWTFINKSAPVFLTSLYIHPQGNKTIQSLPSNINPLLIQTSKYFPSFSLTFYYFSSQN